MQEEVKRRRKGRNRRRVVVVFPALAVLALVVGVMHTQCANLSDIDPLPPLLLLSTTVHSLARASLCVVPLHTIYYFHFP